MKKTVLFVAFILMFIFTGAAFAEEVVYQTVLN